MGGGFQLILEEEGSLQVVMTGKAEEDTLVGSLLRLAVCLLARRKYLDDGNLEPYFGKLEKVVIE